MNRVQSLSTSTLAVLSFFVLPHLSLAQAPAFPKLSGPYEVGRVDLDVLDAERAEIFTAASDDKRRLLVTLYYPAEVPQGTPHDSYAPAYLMTPLKFTAEQRAWVSSGYADVPVRDGRYPVLLFSPGLGNMTFLYSSLLYNLASEGYVVAALWHPYNTALTAFPDGSIIERNEAGGVSGTTLDEQMPELERLGAVWVADLHSVTDRLHEWNDTLPLLQNHLDLDRIGAFGHSFGGAAALQAAYEDERIDAVVNMDGTMFGEASRKGSRVPLLYLASDPPQASDEQLREMRISREEFDAEEKQMNDARLNTLMRSAHAKLHTLENSRHSAYSTDQLFLPAAAQEQRARSIAEQDPAGTFEQIRTWVSDFMAQYLRPD